MKRAPNHDLIVNSMQGIIQSAKDQGRWLMMTMGGIVIAVTPERLEKEMENNRLVLGPKSWQMVSEKTVAGIKRALIVSGQRCDEDFVRYIHG